jgi:hypothetical protein
MPFDMAPTRVKINNYLDEQLKQITPSIKTQGERNFINPFSFEGNKTSRFEQNHTRLTNFDE